MIDPPPMNESHEKDMNQRGEVIPVEQSDGQERELETKLESSFNPDRIPVESRFEPEAKTYVIKERIISRSSNLSSRLARSYITRSTEGQSPSTIDIISPFHASSTILADQSHIMDQTEQEMTNRDLRVRVPYSKISIMKKHLLTSNRIYRKPNITVLGQMVTQLTAVSLLFVITYGDTNRFTLVFWIFFTDILSELSVSLILLNLGYPFIRKRVLVVPLVRSCSLTILYILKQKPSLLKLLLMPMLVVPFVFQVVKPLTYDSVKVNHFSFTLVILFCEVLLVLRLTSFSKIGYSGILSIPIYYLSIMVLLTVGSLLASICLVCKGTLNCFKKFPLKLFLVQFFIGLDSLVMLVSSASIYKWVSSVGSLLEYESKEASEYASEESRHSIISILREGEAFYHYLAFLVLSSALVYSVIRHPIIYVCSRNETDNPPVLIEMRRRDGPRSPTEAPSPVKVQKPSKAQSFLNLLRIAPNYFVESRESESKVEPLNYESKRIKQEVQQGEGRIGSERIERIKESEACGICLTSEANCLIVPCSHGGICKECSISILKQTSTCPYCRNPVEKIKVIKVLGGITGQDIDRFEVIEEITR